MAVTLVIAWSPDRQSILAFRRVKNLQRARIVADALYQQYPHASRFSMYEEIDAYAAPSPDAYEEERGASDE